MYKLLIFSCLIILSFSCKKDEEVVDPGSCEPIELKVQDYMPMSVGNYWIYEEVEVDSAGSESKLGSIDSIRITETRTTRGEKYFVFRRARMPYSGKWTVFQAVRDSSGYLVNEKGEILMSVSNFTDTLSITALKLKQDTAIDTYAKMQAETPLKIFKGIVPVINYQITQILRKSHSSSGKMEEAKFNNYYAKGIGLVLDNYAYYQPGKLPKTFIEIRLIRYFVQEN